MQLGRTCKVLPVVQRIRRASGIAEYPLMLTRARARQSPAPFVSVAAAPCDSFAMHANASPEG
jgi:hypothetical protein